MNPLDNPSTTIAWKLRDVHHMHMLTIKGILERYTLYCGQPRILHTIADMNGSTQKEIADKLQISAASLAVSLKRMLKAGLVEKLPDENDLRANRIRITPLGLQLNHDCQAECASADQRMLDGLNEAEIDNLKGILTKIYDNLRKMEAQADGKKTASLPKKL